jgi:hypothetical protein
MRLSIFNGNVVPIEEAFESARRRTSAERPDLSLQTYRCFENEGSVRQFHIGLNRSFTNNRVSLYPSLIGRWIPLSARGTVGHLNQSE